MDAKEFVESYPGYRYGKYYPLDELVALVEAGIKQERKEREDKALDALIVAAYLPENMDDEFPSLDDPEPVLSEEDQKALDKVSIKEVLDRADAEKKEKGDQ